MISILLQAVFGTLGLLAPLLEVSACEKASSTNIALPILLDRQQGQLCLPVKSRLFHPSRLDKPVYTRCISNLYHLGTGEYTTLDKVVSEGAFRAINRLQTHYADEQYLYAYMLRPHPEPFYYLPLAEVEFVGQKYEWFIFRDNLYRQGYRVLSLDGTAVQVLVFDSVTEDDIYEMLLINNEVFYGENPLTKDQLQYMDDLSDQDRLTLQNLLSPKLQSSPKALDVSSSSIRH